MAVKGFLTLFIVIGSLGPSQGNSDPLESSKWPQFDMVEQCPGEPLSPIDFQNAEALLDTPAVTNPAFTQDPIELAGLFEGDIMLTSKQNFPQTRNNLTDESLESEEPEDNTKNAIVKETQKWPGGVIPYFIAAQFDALERSTIARAFLEYQRSTCIVFRPRTTEPDYIHIMKGNGCSSLVGRNGGGQPVVLGNGCVFPGIAMHELMHAVGFWHEQSRWDRDDHVNVYFQNISPGMDFNFRKYSWRDIQNLSTPYDTGSILHYGPYAFAKDKRYPTILPKNPNDKMGQRNSFSPNDILKINRLYNCNGAGNGYDSTPTPPAATPAPGPSGQTRCMDSHKYCPAWAQRNECTKNSIWMNANCKKSCDQCEAPCSDSNQYCGVWSARGECEQNPDYMRVYCSKSCGTCVNSTAGYPDSSASEPDVQLPPCEDKHVHCKPWSERGECSVNPKYMLKTCPKSCKLCPTNVKIPPKKAPAGKRRKRSVNKRRKEL